MKKIFLLANVLLVSSSTFAFADNYYASVKVAYTDQKAKNMDTSLRPGIGQFVAGDDKEHVTTPTIALGYDYQNNWRTEVEYSFEKDFEYTSGSTTFPTSLNHHKVKTQSVFLNAYRDVEVYENISLFGSVGLGVAKVKSSGWQGNDSRQYASNTDTNLAYSIGAGVSYNPIQQVNVDLGYRYVDLGKVESGMNNFVNARGLQDEQMKAHLEKNEFYLGVRYKF
jgi:opacity protein-like surface antigen